MSELHAIPAAPVLAERPGHLIRRAYQVHGSLWSALVSREITPTQFSVLTVVDEMPGCDQIAMSREASLDTSTAGSVVFRLVQRGFIRLDKDPNDRRRNLLWLTETGEQLRQEIGARASAMTDRWVGGLDEAELELLVSLLQRVIDDGEAARFATGAPD